MNGIIREIEAFEIAVPLPRPLQLGAIAISDREYAIVRVRDQAGEVGTAIGLARNAPIAATVRKAIVPHIKGGKLDSYQGIYDRIRAANVCLGTNGIFWRALSLVDCAIYDLLARRADLPLVELLGGRRRAVPSLLVGGYPLPNETPASLKSEIRHLMEFNPAGIKIGSSGDAAQDTTRLKVCREAMSDGTPLMIDLYWQYRRAEDLMEAAATWTQFGMGWIEDPLSWDDYKGAALLANNLPYPVAIGDEQSGLMHFEQLMDQGRVGVIRLDATVCGGVTAFREIARAAADRGIPVACHVFPEIHAQLAALTPNARWVEMYLPDSGLDSMHLITHSQPSLADGCLWPSPKPGLGYDWNEEALSRYRTRD